MASAFKPLANCGGIVDVSSSKSVTSPCASDSKATSSPHGAALCEIETEEKINILLASMDSDTAAHVQDDSTGA